MGGGGSGVPGYSATWYPSSPVSGTDSDFVLVRQSLNAGVPVWRDATDRVILTANVRSTLVSTDAVLPDTGRPFPSELWSVNFGANWIHRFENGWTGGLLASVGSASDRPFHGIEEMNVTLISFLRVPAWNERDSWLFSVFYSSASSVPFPIPGIAYVWSPDDTLRVNIGLPFAVLWQPTEDLTLTASYIPLTNINARATCRVADRVFVYGGYEFLTEAYFLADRVNRKDRFIGLEQRVIVGVRWDVWENASVDLNGGYAFGRRYGEGRSQGSDWHDRVDIDPGAFVGGSVRLRF
jgi:hypothetical protein